MRPDVHVAFDDPHLIVAQYRALIAYRWRQAPTESVVTRIEPVFLGLLQSARTEVVLCNVLPADLALPDGPTRAALERTIPKLDGRCAGVVNVVAGTGFGGASLRAVITGLALVVRPSYPVKAVATPREAAAHLAQWWPADAPATSALDLERALQAVVDAR